MNEMSAINVSRAATSRLTLEGINKSFPTDNGPLSVIEDIGFTQAPGEVVTIVGASGSGKTTLLRIIAGLDQPDTGRVLVDGKRVTSPGPDRAMIFQQFALMSWLTVLDNVLFGLKTSRLSSAERLEKARDAIMRVGLSEFERFYPKDLSGGMQQRVGIARALAVSPSVLLCDEPFAAIDAMTRQSMQTDLLHMVTQQKATVLLVTHDIEEAIYLGDRVLVFSSRPARLIEELEVPIKKPRSHEVRMTPEFQDMRNRVWSCLKGSFRDH